MDSHDEKYRSKQTQSDQDNVNTNEARIVLGLVYNEDLQFNIWN